jgi:hypothetical protein
MRTGCRAAGAAVIAGLLAVSAYRYGMFFDVSFYRWELAIYLIAALTYAAALVLSTRALQQSMNPALQQSTNPALQQSTNRALRTSEAVGWLAAGPFALGALYMLQLTFHPVSVMGTVEQFVRWICYGSFLLFVTTAVRDKAFRPWLVAAVQVAGWAALWGPLAGWFGWMHFPEIIMVSGDEQLSSVGARLAGFFQYPNMLGAVAAAFMLWQLLQLARSAAGIGFLWAPALSAVPAGIVLLLTESRGAWLAAGIGWLAGMLLIRSNERPAWLICSGWLAAASGIGYRAAVSAVPHWSTSGGVGTGAGNSAVFIGFVLGAAAVFIGLRKAADYWLRNGLRWPGWAAGAAGAAALGWMLPSALQGRIGGNYETAAARKLFYEDALVLFRESPWLGRGGDAWRSLFTQVQREPYVGREVHSGYLDLLLDVGLIGLLIFVIWIIALVMAIWRRERIGLVPVGILLLHAAIDFDMSYGFYWLLLLAFAALYMCGVRPTAAAEPAAAAEQAAAAAPAVRRGLPRVVRACAALLAAALLLAAIAAGWRLDRARAWREAAAAAEGAARQSALRAALEANPAWTRIRVELAPLAPLRARAALLAAGLRYEPQSVPLVWELGRTYAELGKLPQAEAYIRLGLRRDRFDSAKQTEAVQLLARLAEEAQAGGRFAEARAAAQAGLALYDSYSRLAAEVAAMEHPANGRRFGMTQAARKAAALCRQLLATIDGTPISGG